MSASKRLQVNPKPGPQTLILGDIAIREVQTMCSKNTVVSDLRERALNVVSYSICWIEWCWKTTIRGTEKGLTELLKTVQCLEADIFISGPILSVGGSVLGVKQMSVHKCWSFSAVWQFLKKNRECRNLFKTNGIFLNKSWVKLFTYNLFYLLRHPLALSAKDIRGKDKTRSDKSSEEEPRPPEEISDQERHVR